ncbi:hypothetical protein [Lysinibacillus sp. NPDC047702]|uniref:hypothetical protein n=1 Tax=unclassified Lysinibacillus TaxID=2636778 RepID=UPI003D01E5A7
MITIVATNINVNKLVNEFVAQNVIPKDVSSDLINDEVLAKTATFTFADSTDIDLVQSIIDAHDLAPIPSPKSETELLKERLEATEQALLQIMFEGMM